MKDIKDYVGAGILFILGLGLLIWYIAVHPAPNYPAPDTQTAATATSTDQTITDHQQYYTVDATYPGSTPLAMTAGPDADAAAVGVMSDFVATTTAQFKEQNNLTNFTAADAAAQGLQPGEQYALQIAYTPSSSANTISYVFSIYEDTLGAHPNGYYQTFTFDSATGAELQLADLFAPGTDYLDALSSLTRASLTSSLGTNGDPDQIDAGTMPADASFSDFALDGTDLVIIFPPYAVGPYSIGPQTVRIPLSQLDSILNPEFQQ